MHEMRTAAIDVPVAWASVTLSVTRLRCAKAAKRIEVLFGMKTFGDPKNGGDPMQLSSDYFGRLLFIYRRCGRAPATSRGQLRGNGVARPGRHTRNASGPHRSFTSHCLN